MMKQLVLSIAMAVTTLAPAAADDRYAVIERGDTVIRVNTQTGRVSFCRDEGGTPVCKLAADEREAWMKEVENLERRVSELESAAPSSSNGLSKQEEQELDKAMRIAESMMRRFFGLMQTLKGELESN